MTRAPIAGEMGWPDHRADIATGQAAGSNRLGRCPPISGYRGGVVTDISWAAQIAAVMLEPLGRRWLHVQAVANQARRVAEVVEDGDLLIAAAYLHDIGYAPELATTGFHPLDGARYVRDEGFPELASLVAHHTGARNEALLRGIDGFAEEFPYEDSLMLRALTYCDLTTGPDGSRSNVEDRVDEIIQRYGPDHVVSRGVMIGHPEFKRIEAEFDALLAVSGSLASSQSGSR